MDLRELRLILRRHWLVALLAFQACLLIGAAAAYLPAKTYRATSVLEVSVVTINPETGEEQRLSVIEANFQLPSLEQRVSAASLRERVRPEVPPASRPVRVEISGVTDASILRITGTGKSPVAASDWVNATAERLALEYEESGSPLSLAIIDPATPRRKVVSPNVTATLAASFVLGLIAAVFAALAADRIRKSFDVHQTIRDRVGTTVLGEIPVARPLRRGKSVFELLSDDGDREMAAAFENIRANVEFRSTFDEINSLAVLSYDAGVGKSTVSAGLAYAMASVGKEVILVEADLRRPVLYERLDARPGPGIGEMAAMDGLEPPLQPTALRSLQLLAAGLPAGQPADIIARTLPRVIEELVTPERMVILDPPPLNGVPETATIAALSKYVILVINSDSSGLSDLPDALDRIHESGASLLGVVVNRVPRRRLKDSYYSYSQARKTYPQPGDEKDEGGRTTRRSKRKSRAEAGQDPAAADEDKNESADIS